MTDGLLQTLALKVQAMEELLHKRDGQLLATQIAVRALLLQQPNREDAVTAIAAELTKWQAHALHASIPDAVVDGFQSGMKRVLPSDDDMDRDL